MSTARRKSCQPYNAAVAKPADDALLITRRLKFSPEKAPAAARATPKSAAAAARFTPEPVAVDSSASNPKDSKYLFSPPKKDASKPTKTKRRKAKERSWNARAERGGESQGHGDCAWRFDNRNDVHTAVLFAGSPLKIDPLKPNAAFIETLKARLTHEPTFTPVVAIKKLSQFGSPEVVVNAAGEELTYQGGNGLAKFFQTGAAHPEKPLPEIAPGFAGTAIYAAVAPITKSVVEVSTEVTAAEMKAVAKEKRLNGGRRNVSQNTVMGGSAPEYLQAAGFGADGEWGHGVGNQFKGKESQHKTNFAGESTFTNTRQLGEVEAPLADLVKIYGASRFDVKTHNTKQLLKKAEYVITTPDFKLPLAIPAQVVTPGRKPHRFTKVSMRALVAAKAKEFGRDITAVLPKPKAGEKNADHKDNGVAAIVKTAPAAAAAGAGAGNVTPTKPALTAATTKELLLFFRRDKDKFSQTQPPLKVVGSPAVFSPLRKKTKTQPRTPLQPLPANAPQIIAGAAAATPASALALTKSKPAAVPPTPVPGGAKVLSQTLPAGHGVFNNAVAAAAAKATAAAAETAARAAGVKVRNFR